MHADDQTQARPRRPPAACGAQRLQTGRGRRRLDARGIIQAGTYPATCSTRSLWNDGEVPTTGAMEESCQAKATEHEEEGVSVHVGVCTTDVACTCFAFICQRLQEYLSLPAAMSSAASKRHFLPFSTTPGFTGQHECHHRSGFLLPIVPCVEVVLKSFAASTVGTVLAQLLGDTAVLRELVAIISEPGAAAQAFHSDSNWDEQEPRVVTVFLAMQDILAADMGPTRFCARTHKPSCFSDKRWIPPTQRLAEDRHPTWFQLHAGDAILMDPTTWHCGSANTSSNKNRTLLSFSFVEDRGNASTDVLRLSHFRGDRER